MNPTIVVPPSAQPNYEARILFFDYLDAEWPALKESLCENVWPAYRSCWQPAPSDLKWPPRGQVRKGCTNGRPGFLAPLAAIKWSRLVRSRRCACLHHALVEWGSSAGLGIIYDWILASALVTLGQFSPGQQIPEHSARPLGSLLSKSMGVSTYTPSFVWRYDREFQGQSWGLPFEPKLVGTVAHPEEPARWLPRHDWYFGSWEQFEARMQKQFLRELSGYRKRITRQWGLNKKNYVNYARWTIARLSGLTWREIVDRYAELQKYSEGETQAKKRVREFASEIGLTLRSALKNGATRGTSSIQKTPRRR